MDQALRQYELRALSIGVLVIFRVVGSTWAYNWCGQVHGVGV